MNRIYKVIYSKARQCAMVVSELAKSSHKKSQKEAGHASTPALARIIATALAAGALTWGIAPGVSWAADNTKVAVVFDDKSSLMSTDATISHEILQDSVRFPEGEGQSIALGKGAHAYMQGGWKPYYVLFGMEKAAGAIAIGEGFQALSQSIAIGNRTYTGDIGDVNISNYNNFYGNGGAGSGVGSVLLGTNSYTGGTLSTLIGDYSIMSTAYPNAYDSHYGSYLQNAGAVSVGALNSIESATTENDNSGIANSIVGLANKTNNANGALIYGAGNTITNSFADVATPDSAGSAAEAAQSFRESVQQNPGGAALAIGGGNKIDHAVRSQAIGVNNTLTGNLYHEDGLPFLDIPDVNEYSAQYNMVDGYNNNVANVNHAYVIGANNNIQGKTFSDATKNGVLSETDREKAQKDDNLIVIGDNHTLANDVSNNIILGTADKTLTTSVSNVVMIGRNADAQKEGGVALGADSVAAIDKGQVGYDPANGDHQNDTTGIWKSMAAAVSVGNKEKNLTRQITNVAAGTEDTDAVNVAQLKQARTKYYSVNEKTPNVFGDAAKEYAQYLNDDNKGAKEFAGLAAGYMTYAGGIASTVTGSFSGIMNEAAQPGSNDFRGAAALSYGMFNLNDNTSASQPFSGVANSIVGQANVTTDSNAAMVYGAGNSVTNSYRGIELQKAGAIMQSLKDPKQLNEALKAAVPTSGAQVMVMGGGNTVDKAYMTQVVGVGNTVTGSDKEYVEGTSTQLNYVDGFYNKVENGKNDYVIGSHNTLTGSNVDTNKSNLVLGDNHKLTDRTNNVILGSADKELTTSASDAVLIGHNADVKVDGGVALGDSSVATTDRGAVGYDPKGEDHSADTTGIWKSTAAAVSVGNKKKNLTRQITNVAAGTEDTDAVNVAQLKQVSDVINNNINANKVHYYSVKSKYQDDKSNYNNNGAKGQESIVLGIASSSDAGYSTVIGMGSSAKKRGTSQASGMYDTVVGQYLDTTGSYNSVFGTFYQNGSIQQLTKVYGDRNTVLGAGNIVGIGKNNTKVKSDENVVIGLNNSVEGSGSIIVGNATTVNGPATMNATSLGHVNHIYDQLDGGGQWGVALGNNLTVKGEYALAVGNNSTAQGDETVAIGYNANASVAGGAAIGSGSVASVDKGVEGYKPNSSVDTSADPAGTWKSTDAAVSVGKADGSMTRQITGVAAGTNATDAVNVAQLRQAVAGAKDGNDTLKSDTNALKLDGHTLSMSVKDTANHEVSGSVDLSELARAVDTNTTYTLTGEANPDNNTTTITLKDSNGRENSVTVATKDTDTRNTVKAGENVTLDTKDNADGSHEYTVNVKADGKVEAGSTKIVSGDTVYNETRVKQDGTYVKVSNTAGENLSALDNQVTSNTQNINYLNGRVGELGDRINKVGAGAAALAALHPLDYDPEDKWDFAAGVGNYRNATAAAVGLFYRPNERTMFNLGWTMGDNRNMVNGGFSVKFGKSNKYIKYSKAEMASVIDNQSREIAELKAKDAQNAKDNAEMKAEIEALKKQVEALAAKK